MRKVLQLRRRLRTFVHVSDGDARYSCSGVNFLPNLLFSALPVTSDGKREKAEVYSRGVQTLPSSSGFRHVIIAIGLFLAFASCMAVLAGIMLVWPGTVLDELWSLNETAHAELRGAGTYIGPAFWLLSVTLVAGAVGWFKQQMWAFRLTIAIFCIQIAGDLVNLVRGDFVRGTAGVVIAGALLLYLLRSNIRTVFQ